MYICMHYICIYMYCVLYKHARYMYTYMLYVYHACTYITTFWELKTQNCQKFKSTCDCRLELHKPRSKHCRGSQKLKRSMNQLVFVFCICIYVYISACLEYVFIAFTRFSKGSITKNSLSISVLYSILYYLLRFTQPKELLSFVKIWTSWIE